jgi:IS4 transposase
MVLQNSEKTLQGFEIVSSSYPNANRMFIGLFPLSLFHDRTVVLTNNMFLPALVIAKLYKCRWQIELFFKWIKQNLKIKTFYGYSDNAVRTQIWISICTYVIVAIVKKELKLEASLSKMLQIISVSVFDKVPLHQLLADNQDYDEVQNSATIDSNQLLFSDL